MPIESQNHYDIEDSLLGSDFESLREKEDNSRNLMNGWIYTLVKKEIVVWKLSKMWN